MTLIASHADDGFKGVSIMNIMRRWRTLSRPVQYFVGLTLTALLVLALAGIGAWTGVNTYSSVLGAAGIFTAAVILGIFVPKDTKDPKTTDASKS